MGLEVVLDHRTHKGKEGLVRYAYKAEQHMFDGGDSTIVVGRYPTLVPPICTFNYAFRLLSNGQGNLRAEGPKGPLKIMASGATIGHTVVPWLRSVDFSIRS